MRKLLVSACFAVALLVSGVAAPTAKADHGYGGRGFGGGYGAGYGAPGCHGHNVGYGGYRAGYGGGYVAQYQTAIVPVYPGGVYQSYSFGSPFGGYQNYGPVASPFGVGYGGGYGVGYGSGFHNPVPRVQLRIGF